jgi:LPXTG-site transpeptidase (sortase) family protein
MRILVKVLKSVIALLVISYAVYFVLNGPTIVKLFKQRKAAASNASSPVQKTIDRVSKLQQTSSPATGASSEQSDLEKLKADLARQFKNDFFYYPRLGITAPVEWDVLKYEVAQRMPDGLIQLSGTAELDQNGDILVAGHSSYYWWNKGKYKNVFAPLTQSKAEDGIVIRKKDVTYFYKVSRVYQIGGSEGLSINVGGSYPKKLNLMTCVPIGTSLRRLIVEAEFVRAI